MQERNGLSFGVRKVCRLFYGDNYEGDEGALDLTLSSISSRDGRKAVGVIVDEIDNNGVDLDGNADKKLKYPVPDMSEHNIADYLSYGELALIAGNVDDVDFDNLSASQELRYDEFVEAWYKKQDVPAGPTNRPH